MVLTRLILPRWLLGTALVVTALTVFMVFYAPLMAVQLLVIWVSYAILRRREG